MSIENIKPMDVVCKTQKIDRCRWDGPIGVRDWMSGLAHGCSIHITSSYPTK